ncbi:MAG: Ig-like domain-containing protein [Muribaculaceae bacterium]|nr:Ig-like domain-containing protein [Muribaculaceae bacterium]
MKRFLLTLLLALSLGIGAAWAESTTATINFPSAPSNLASLIVDNNITISFIKDNGTYAPTWNSDKHVRFYGGNKVTVSAKDAIISQVVFNTVSSRPFKTAATATTGILTINSDTKTTWEQVNANDEISSFSISNGTSGTAQVQITSIEVTYEISSNRPNLSYPSQVVRINLGETVVNDLINPYNVTVVYDSSNKDVATVNDDGSVNVLGVGSTVISASSQENEEYEAGYASYKLTVKDPNAPKFGLVTSVDELYDGAMALIVCKTKNDAMSTTQSSNNRGIAAVQIVDNEIDPSDEVAIVRLEKKGDKYALYVTNGEGTGYLYHPAGKNYLNVQEQVAEAIISFTDAGDAEILFDANYKIKRNSSTTIYSCYTSAQTAIQLYVQPDPRKKLSISFDKEEYEILEGESFDGATLSGELPDGISVAYSSSDTEIATVDETTGVVTALKAGKVTITATTGKTADYNSASASYTLIVRKSGTP